MKDFEWNTFVSADNVLDENINTLRKPQKLCLQASREVGLEVNTEKTKYMVMCHHQNAGQDSSLLLLIANKSLENVVEFKYLEQK
jgi:PP-loop superfamily ATP-utilizing enzyme